MAPVDASQSGISRCECGAVWRLVNVVEVDVYTGNLSVRKWAKAPACLFVLQFKKMRPDVPCAFLKFKKMRLDVPCAFLKI